MSLRQDLAILSLALDVEKGHTLGASRRAALALSLTNEQAKACLRAVDRTLKAANPASTHTDALHRMAALLRKCSTLPEFMAYITTAEREAS